MQTPLETEVPAANSVARLKRGKLFGILGAALIGVLGFALGFIACVDLRSGTSEDFRQQLLTVPGDAPAPVRAEVVSVLGAFQQGYIRRNPGEIDDFMRRLFPENEDILLMGTDATEWRRGYRAVGQFIQADWQSWGDFRFDVDRSIVWSQGDMAWTASVGSLQEHGKKRPLRFSSILTRTGKGWQFRQVHFQWDESSPMASDLFRFSTHRHLLKLLLQHLHAALALKSAALFPALRSAATPTVENV